MASAGTFAAFDITSANARLVLTVEELFPGGVELQQFATDQSFSQNDVSIAETRMGVDGFMVAGFTPNIKEVTIMLEATSPSFEVMSTIAVAMETNKKIYNTSLVATCPSIGRIFTWSNGTMKQSGGVPAAKQVFDPTSWLFHFALLEVSQV